jgi:hypothetical protein
MHDTWLEMIKERFVALCACSVLRHHGHLYRGQMIHTSWNWLWLLHLENCYLQSIIVIFFLQVTTVADLLLTHDGLGIQP